MNRFDLDKEKTLASLTFRYIVPFLRSYMRDAGSNHHNIDSMLRASVTFCRIGMWLRLGVILLLSSITVLYLGPVNLYADEPSFDLRRPFGTAAETIRSIAVGDIDGDGDLDIIVSNRISPAATGSQSAIYLNDGASNFHNARNFGMGADHTVIVAVGDMDGDGDLDIITGNPGQQNRVYINDGVGNFPSAHNFGTGSNYLSSLAVGDMDSDGDLDITVSNTGQQNVLYLNDGAGNFPDAHNFGTGASSLAVGDIDGDADLDIVAGNSGQKSVIYINDQTYNFGNTRTFDDGTNEIRSLTLGDVDSDDDLDIIVGNSGIYSGRQQQNAVYLNDGVGNFMNVRKFGTGSDNTWSIVVGDIDADDDLDIVVGNYNQQNVIYINDGVGNFTNTLNFGTGTDYTANVAMADMDGDNDLDIVVGNTFSPIATGSQSAVYLNNGAGNFLNTRNFGAGSAYTANTMVGDIDKDGDLDIVADKSLYLNDGTGSFLPVQNFNTSALAIGDIDGDHDLDIVSYEVIYLNDGTGNFSKVRSFSPGSSSLAIGDMDGDDDLDIVLGNYILQSTIYLNDGIGNFSSRRDFGDVGNETTSVAVGDMDGDSDLDIIIGNSGAFSGNQQQNIVYLNDGSGKFSRAHRFGTGSDYTESVAVGDVDDDGDLDIIIGNFGQQNVIYLNDGTGNFADAFYFGAEADKTTSVAVGDIDNNGYLDIIVGNSKQPSAVYLNNGTGNFNSVRTFGSSADDTVSIATGDVDSDSDLDIIVSRFGQPNIIYWNGIQSTERFSNSTPRIKIVRPGVTPSANFFSMAERLSEQLIAIPYTLYGNEGEPVGRVEAFFSLDGGSNWQPAIASAGTSTTNLATSLTGVEHLFTWDTYASGFFGQSDAVVFRLVAYPLLRQPVNAGSFRYINAAAGPYLRPYVSTTTFPFRVRGTQVQVYKEGQRLHGALVYRLQEKLTIGAEPMPNSRQPLGTDSHGYLQGRGELHLNDRLVALWPVPATNFITFTNNYTLYQVSAKPTTTTLDLKPVLSPGVQVLTVTAENKLLLFNLDVALEWDARKDVQFMQQLQFNLQRTSQLLFDWTNGQAALGQVRLFQDAKRNTTIPGFLPWADSHIRIYATNRMRPSATEGGIISPTLTYTETVVINGQAKTITYGAGQVHMGAIWNRYGETSGTLGEDWPRALAHELGHYLFFLEDDYLGVNEQGVLVTIPAEGKPEESCPGVMNDPYREAQSEFQPALGWANSGCIKTLSQQSVGRSDWETIAKFYPLTPPTQSFTGQNHGPGTLPLAVTQLTVISPTAAAQTVDVPIFYLLSGAEGTYLPGRNAQAYLFQGDWVTDLGQPTLDQVQAWGARPGDRLCIYEPAAGYQGCEQITAQDDQVAMQAVSRWQPAITITPVTSRTLALSVTTAAGTEQVAARLYPTDQAAPACILLQSAGAGRYVGAFPTLPMPALDGYVHVWLQSNATSTCSEPQGAAVAETVTGYAIGGNPIHRRARRTFTRGDGVHRRARRAPAISADGQVIVFGEALDAKEDEEWFFTLQATSTITGLPPGRTLVGQAYRLTASPNAPPLTDTSISFSYLGDQVPSEEEKFVRIYFWAETATACQPQPAPCWQPLETIVNTEYNVASAKTEGPGLYALMSSIEIALTGPGWNLFAYTVQYTQTVAQALSSIAGHYTVVWGYEPGTPNDPWRAYSPKVVGTIFEPLVNDLAYLAFGRGYWIQMIDTATLHLESTPTVASASLDQAAQPPTTYYGSVMADADFAPTAGMPVTAWVDNHLCGQSAAQNIDGQVVYTIRVAADSGGAYAGCGAAGRQVVFKVNGVPMVTSARWDNMDVWQQDLLRQFDNRLFLPLTAKSASANGNSFNVPTDTQRDEKTYLPSVRN